MCETAFGLDVVSSSQRHGNRQSGLLSARCWLVSSGWEDDMKIYYNMNSKLYTMETLMELYEFYTSFVLLLFLLQMYYSVRIQGDHKASQGHALTLSCHVCEKEKFIFHNSHFLYGQQNGKVRIAFSGRWRFCAALRPSKGFSHAKVSVFEFSLKFHHS